MIQREWPLVAALVAGISGLTAEPAFDLLPVLKDGAFSSILGEPTAAAVGN